jgi:tetratricopeptide (TPR) repeat protein
MLKILAYQSPLAMLRSALAVDENFCLAHVFIAYIHHLVLFQRDDAKSVADHVRKALELAKAGRVNAREKKHVRALEAATQGHLRVACRMWEEILDEYPLDVLALKMVTDMYFYLGDSANIRDCIAHVYTHWEESFGGRSEFGYLLGLYAFGLEETNLFRRAEEAGRKAVEIQLQDPWAIHAVAHVMEMESRTGEGIAWLEETKSGWTESLLSCHLWWHEALFFADLGKWDRVLQNYDEHIRGEKHALELTDAASLLLRCQIHGVDVGDRWEAVRELWAPFLEKRQNVFNDLHGLISHAASRDFARAEALLASMRQYSTKWKEDPELTQSEVMHRVGLPLGEAVVRFYEGDHAGTAERISSNRHRIVEIGGSGAQRDLFTQLMLKSAQFAGHNQRAEALAWERVRFRPASTLSWNWLRDILVSKGDTKECEKAATRGRSLLKDHLATAPVAGGQPRGVLQT